jgi:hypothetical protein
MRPGRLGQCARDRGELPGAIAEDEVRGVEHQAFPAAVETRILGGVMARGDGDAGQRTVDHLGEGFRVLGGRHRLDRIGVRSPRLGVARHPVPGARECIRTTRRFAGRPRLGRPRRRRILRPRVDLDAPLLGAAERIQDHRELRAASPEQGADRLVVRIDGGQPERQHRPVGRHARDDLMVRPPQPLDAGQVGHQVRPALLAKRPFVHRADDGGEPRLGDGADLLPADAGQAGQQIRGEAIGDGIDPDNMAGRYVLSR